MPEEPLPHREPRPVVPLDGGQGPAQAPSSGEEIIDAQIVDQRLPAPLAPVPVQTINVPDQTMEIPTANVYAPPNANVPPSMTMNPPGPPPYYPPAYPPYTPPMEYRAPAVGPAYGRPPMVTTLAISSIVVASLSIIACVFSGCTGAMVMGNARMSRAVAFTPAPTAATPNFPYAMAQPDRQAVYTAVQGKMMRPFTKARENQFEALLARYGKQIIDDPEGAPLTAQRVGPHISEAKQQFAGPGKKGPDLITLTESGKLNVTPGTFEISDDIAVFRFKDMTEPLRFSLKATDSIEPPSAPVNPFGLPNTTIAQGLDDNEARAVVSRVNVLSNNNLNPMQNSTLTNLLKSTSSGNFIAPSSTIPGLTAQVKSAVVNNDSSITITFTQGPLTLDANGQLLGAGNLAITPTTMPAGMPNPFGTFTVNVSSCKLAITESILSLLLAGFLMTCGVLALRQSAMTRKLYLVWAVAKVAMVVLGIIAFNWMLSSMESTSGIGVFSDVMRGWAGTALWLGIIGAIFPLIVLGVVLLSKSMRDYFKMTA